MSETVLCMGIGTTSLKASLITAVGEVVSFCLVPFENPHDLFIASSWLTYFEKALTLLDKNATSQEKVQIKAIVVSGNGPTVVTDSGLTILWNDNSFNSKDEGLTLPHEAEKSLFIPKILTLKEKYSYDFTHTKHIFSGPEYFIYLLTGNAVTVLPEERFISAYWTKEICDVVKIPYKKMPKFVKIGAVCGEICSGVFEGFELHSRNFSNIIFDLNCKVIAGGPDFVVALIGTNTLESGKICDRCGSSEGINFCVQKQIFADGVRTLPSVIPGLWNISVLIPNSGAMSENERLEKIKIAIEKLKKIANENDIKFPTKMSVTGGQAGNLLLLKEKSEILGMEIVHSVVNGKDFIHSELLGDACAGFVGLGIYTNLIEAAGAITHENF